MKIQRDKKILGLYRQAEIFEQMIEDQMRELQKTHQDLATKNAYLTQIMTAMTDLLLVLSPHLEVMTVNAAALAHLGYSEDELLGMSLRAFVESKLPSDEEFSNDVIRGAIRDRDVLFVTKTGTVLPITLSASAILDAHQNLQGIVCVARDRTEREVVQSRQVLSQKMESIGRLAAGIAHEINTPMQFIGDNTRFLQDSFQELSVLLSDLNKMICSDLVPEEVSSVMKTREEASDIPYLLNEIPKAISQTLEGINRVERIVLAMKQFTHHGQDGKLYSDINEGILGTMTISRSEWKYVADLETHLDKNLPRVLCCLDEINQVILNLIVNATDAIRDKMSKGITEKGKITITTSTDAGMVRISVTDNGMGIPKGIIDKIFDLFFTTKPEGKGTGQGLAIVHDIIVKKHNGRIDVKSEPGIGTTFHLYLPISDGQQTASPIQ